MAVIRIRNTGEEISGQEAVGAFLASQGVIYRHWNLDVIPASIRDKFTLDDAEKSELLGALKDQIESLATERGYVKWDIVCLSDATPNLDELLKKFEQVHTHTEDEVRAIAAGSGIFIIKGEAGYFDVVLAPGDVISVPENNPHFFTLTDEHKVVAVRLFIDPSGWVAHPFADPDFVQA